jgi:hypothetical protein
MDATQRFIAEENVSRFVALLHSEGNPNARSTLQRLLIEEESRFGELSEQLEVVQRQIDDSVDRVEKQKVRLVDMAHHGQDARAAELTLQISQELLELLHSHRKRLRDALDARDLISPDKVDALRGRR